MQKTNSYQSAEGRQKLTEDARTRIKHLLDVSLPEMLDQSYAGMTRGSSRSVNDASNNAPGLPRSAAR